MPEYVVQKLLFPFLHNNPAMKNTAKKSFDQANFVAGCAVVGGILGGNVGSMVAGLSCSILAYLKNATYEDVLRKMLLLPDNRQAELIGRLKHLLHFEGYSKEKFWEELHSEGETPEGREEIWKLCLESLS